MTIDLKNKTILVMGLGRSGAASALFFNARGARVKVSDSADTPALQAQAANLRRAGIEVELGGHGASFCNEADAVCLSPGVPHTIAPVERLRRRAVPVWGEMEWAARFLERKLVAVTGTNGKTTTTALIGQMLSNSGWRVFTGGNIGAPLIGFVAADQPAEVVVAEVSSFQLDTMQSLRPKVAVLLNIAADHLDRYDDMAAYSAAKARIFKNQAADDLAIYNADDTVVRLIGEAVSSRRGPFVRGAPSTGETAPTIGAWINGDRIHCRLSSSEYDFDATRARLIGTHNRENIAAAALAALAAGATCEGIQTTINTFEGMAHRMELAGHIDGVTYINDSKATNVAAVLRALESFDTPIVLLMGGLDKGDRFERLAPSVAGKVKQLIAMGAAAETIARALKDNVPLATVANMNAALSLASRHARSGDVVLLSPGCASFDQYKNYAQRGNDFKQKVGSLK
jgi:UDP-N-acetylmuramoylalanine--D-glutamate ligase